MTTCAYCSKSNLVWRKLEGRWRLYAKTPDGKADLLRVHLCISDAAIHDRTRGPDKAWKD